MIYPLCIAIDMLNIFNALHCRMLKFKMKYIVKIGNETPI